MGDPSTDPSRSDAVDARDRVEPTSFHPPAEFDDYVLIAPLGRGQMGHVYLAQDTMLARHVAIKFIAMAEPDVEARQRFLTEARAAARLQHPNVVTIYRVGELEERPYLITEFVRGQSLEQLEKPIPWTRALVIGIDLARGLAAAHRSGVLHCDIKSANAMVEEGGGAKLLDFGLARFIQSRGEDAGPDPEPKSAHPGEGVDDRSSVGTPDFMAPEIWGGEPATRRSDVFSLGVVLYELCTGKPPFHDVPMAELMRAVQDRDARSLVTVAPGVDPRFGGIVDRCLRRAPLERFASGDELRHALEALERTAAGPLVRTGNPYRGLRPFEADHRSLFFGRSVEIGVLLDRLRVESFVLVTGDSGVGKSSLCRAGVLPALREGALGAGRSWSVCTFVPGKQPLASLAAALGGTLGLEPEKLVDCMREGRGGLAHALARHLGDSAGVVLFIDQTEELMTVSDRSEAKLVEAALAALADGLPGVRILATLRADFLTRFAGLQALGENLSAALYFLRPLSPERIREVIVGPAIATGARFESDGLIDTLAAHAEGLPLLSFALAELWEMRDKEGVLTAAALDTMGGVAGALARHADDIFAGLVPGQRTAARKLLLRLVTLDNTRVRRTDLELRGADPNVRGALDALVRGRLLVAQDDEHGSAYELAHEVLINGWGMLRRWLTDGAEARVTQDRLSTSATEWKRLGMVGDVLWTARQLDELVLVDPSDLNEHETAFVVASRKAVDRGRWVRRAALVGAPLLIALIYGGAVLKARLELSRRVDLQLAEATAALTDARRSSARANELRALAFASFDENNRDRGEEIWSQVLPLARDVERAYARASRGLEAAVAQDPSRTDGRALLGDALYERALLAERDGKLDQRDELVQRIMLYDLDGSRQRRWNAPASLAVKSVAAGTHISLESLDAGPRDLGVTPLGDVQLERGSFVLVASAEGRATVRQPFVAERGGRYAFDTAGPAASQVPDDYVYVPRGRFEFGTTGDDASRRGFFDTVPAHAVEADAFLIGRNEVTFGEWLRFLESLPPGERARHMPRGAAKIGAGGALRLEQLPAGGWQLTIQPAGEAQSATLGQPIRYAGRATHAVQDWSRFPVTGISAEDGEAFTAWLRDSGTLPGARLCSEREWERGARGADTREFPAGDDLPPSAANYDATYGKEAMGPDEVGSHPASQSPFGLNDMSGNAFEWTSSSLEPGRYVVRGGSYFHDQKTARLVNRTVPVASLRDSTLGLRVCVTFRS